MNIRLANLTSIGFISLATVLYAATVFLTPMFCHAEILGQANQMSISPTLYYANDIQDQNALFEEYVQTRQEFLKYQNLANRIANLNLTPKDPIPKAMPWIPLLLLTDRGSSITSNNNGAVINQAMQVNKIDLTATTVVEIDQANVSKDNVYNVIDIRVIDENTVQIKNKGNHTAVIDCYLAGLLLESITVGSGNIFTQNALWDGTEYEYLVKYENEYSLVSVVTPISQESYKSGLFFDGREMINRLFPFWETFVDVIDNSPNPVKKSMMLHGVLVSVYYDPEYLPFQNEEEKNQFVYLMFNIFHQVWCHYQGFPYKTFEFLFLPELDWEWGNNLNMETNAGIAFSSNVLNDHKFRPYMYTHSVNESLFPYTFFFDFTPNAVWISKTMGENIGSSVENDIPLDPSFNPDECILNNPDIPLAKAYDLHHEDNDFSCLRYLYVKARPMYRMIMNRYVENTGKEVKTFFSELYKKLLLENPNFDPKNIESLPLSIPLADFQKILGNIIQDKEYINKLFDKYVYNGQAYDDWNPGIFTSKIIPQIYPLFSHEEKLNQLRDSLVDIMSKKNQFEGIKF